MEIEILLEILVLAVVVAKLDGEAQILLRIHADKKVLNSAFLAGLADD